MCCLTSGSGTCLSSIQRCSRWRNRRTALCLRGGFRRENPRLCVELEYQSSTRVIEPYSLRRSRAGHIILHVHNVDKNEHRSYRVDRIQGARVTDKSFIPRFEIELTPTDPVVIKPTATRTTSSPTRHARSSPSGPTYVYECSFCGKHFKRRKQTTTLNPHNDKDGYPCQGRYAQWIDTEY